MKTAYPDASFVPAAPAGWSVAPLGSMFRRVKETGHPQLELLSVYRDHGVLPKSSRDDNFNKPSDDLATYQRVIPGDVVVNKMKAWQGSVSVSSYEGIVSPAYFVYRSSSLGVSRISSRYLHYFLRSLPLIATYGAKSSGVRPNQWDLDPAAFETTPVHLPPLAGQDYIANFLDRETAKIDALIAKQEQLIATLQEDRIATITHAVTRGLDPGVELEGTGSDVLDAIPSGWTLVSLRRVLIRVDQGVSPQASGELADPGWGVLKAGCVNGGKFEERQHKKLDPDFDIDPAIVVRSGDLLVNRASGSPELVGSAAIVGELHYSLILSDKIFRLVLNDRADTHFLKWVLNCRVYRDQVKQHISGAEGLANNLPSSSLRGFRIPLPGICEQRQIAAFISARTGEIDRLIEKCDSSVGLLREYRTALITDAVTGKIDVREMV